MRVRCALVEWPDGLEPGGAAWETIRRAVETAAPDLLITNEMPFGPWMAAEARVDAEIALRAVERHELGLDALASLEVPAIISSRPVRAGARLANEAFALEAGEVRPLHRKRSFPEEPGWYEATWFESGRTRSPVRRVGGFTVGVLLCTDLMFNEQARWYGRSGADLIAVPRAAGTSHAKWLTAGAMAAIVSGAYVVSSNRVGSGEGGVEFGGKGFAFAPDGSLLAETTSEQPLVVVELDADAARRQKTAYPCYVTEPDA